MSEDRRGGTLDAGELSALGSLDDPTRGRLYEYVVESGATVTRDQAAAALNLERSLVAYHLDKLVDEGLLTVSFARPEGRGGPGAGRPAKHYQRADREFSVNLPPRDYRLLAELLARAMETDASGAVRRALDEAAADHGARLAGERQRDDERHDDLVRSLADQGFEPYDDGDVVRLRNCPFHQLARDHTELVCGMNLALIRGLVRALSVDAEPRLDPAPGRCCVALMRGDEHPR